jgi:tetratricopeptide (TPR) repeat protein
MILDWFNAREAEKIASDLADQFAPKASAVAAAPEHTSSLHDSASLKDLLRRADTEQRLVNLNFYKKAKFANSFRWRLLENGIEPRTADRVTHSLVLHLSASASRPQEQPLGDVETPSPTEKTPDLARRARKAFASGAYDLALEINQELVDREPANAESVNNLGATLFKLGNYGAAEQRFRQALSLKADYAEASYNLGNILRWMGKMEESEVCLRHALKIKPNYVQARSSLGLTLTYLGRLRDARARFEKVLKTAPRDPESLYGMGQIAKAEGRFADAEAIFKRVLEYRPKMANALAAIATLKKMTPADCEWLHAAKELASGGVSLLEEADLRFAIGKYHDDLGEFDEAFRSFQAANELLKSAAVSYDRKGRDAVIDELRRAYTKDVLATVGEGASPSVIPVFVVGMPRSGTSLTEHILASHPSVGGAGEMDFWNNLARTRESEVLKGLLDPATRSKLAQDYLRLLKIRGGDGSRVIDKTPVNSDYLGLIYSVFPNARFIYMERDPTDVCLSCYFQQFLAGLNFTMDLSDLAHYYNGHRKLFSHWQSVLPAESILVVPYAELVHDQEGWTRKMLEFIGLEWNDRCLSFQDTQRVVMTASSWQVRQKLYTHSVGRSQAYKKFLGPLKTLKR